MGRETIKGKEKKAKTGGKKRKKARGKEPERTFPRLNSTAVDFTMRLL